MRWESTRDSFYISCPNANLGNRRRIRKQSTIGFHSKKLLCKRVVSSTDSRYLSPTVGLQNPTTTVICPTRWHCGDRSRVCSPAVLRAPSRLLPF